MQILVADDDITTRLLVVGLLEQIGVHGATEAANGGQALQILAERAFDLIVIDWEMPGCSGVEVVRRIRAGGSSVPILMVTVRAQRAEVLEAIEAGVSDFLTKPIEAAALCSKLRKFCKHDNTLKGFKQMTDESAKIEYLNSFISSVISLFDTMLDTRLVRGTPFAKSNPLPEHDVSGVIGLTGKATGTAVLSLGEETALRCTECLLGERPAEIDSDVVDTVGELANIVAGGAKAQLQQLSIDLSLPSVITGKDHAIGFPSGLIPICVPFECPWGPVSLQVGLQDQPKEPAAC